MAEQMMTTVEVAKRWRVSRVHVRALVIRGELRGFYVGKAIRIPLSAVLAYERRGAASDAGEAAAAV